MAGMYTAVARGFAPSGEPIRELHAETRDGILGMKMASLDVAFGTSFANHPERLFALVDSVQMAGIEQRGGLRWQVLEVRTRLMNGKVPVRAMVWVDDLTGRVLEMKGFRSGTVKFVHELGGWARR